MISAILFGRTLESSLSDDGSSNSSNLISFILFLFILNFILTVIRSNFNPITASLTFLSYSMSSPLNQKLWLDSLISGSCLQSVIQLNHITKQYIQMIKISTSMKPIYEIDTLALFLHIFL